jgi:hypothetical protein
LEKKRLSINIRFSVKQLVKYISVALGDTVKIIGYLKILSVLDNEIHEASGMIKGIANDTKDAQLLISIPGISFYSALLISSEIGDINRFPEKPSKCLSPVPFYRLWPPRSTAYLGTSLCRRRTCPSKHRMC